MKSVVLSAVLLAASIAPATAQTATSEPAPAAAPAAAAKFSLDTPIETIVADPAGKAVIDADLPGTTTHPMYEQFKGMSLNQVAPMSNGAITDTLLAKVATDLAAIK